MRKSKKKPANLTVKNEQTKDALVSPVAETVEATVPPVQESAPDETIPAPKRGERKVKAEASVTEGAPKRVRKAKADKAERAPLKLKRKADIPAKAEETILLQYGGQELDVAALKERVIAAYIEAGHRRGRISKLNLYIKPEDRKVYYVINDKITGSIEF